MKGLLKKLISILTAVLFTLLSLTAVIGATGEYIGVFYGPETYNRNINNAFSYNGAAYSGTILGDVDSDGALTLSDAVAILRYLAKLDATAGTGFNINAADVTKDGSVNLSDAVKILRILAKLDEPVKADEIWIATWGAAMLTPGAEHIPSNPSLNGNTVRQQIRVSVGGNKLRLVLSNEYGSSPLVIEDIRIARLSNPSSFNVQLDTEKSLTCNGSSSFTVPAGQRITTDVLEYDFNALEDLAITIKLGSVPNTLTCHTASRCSTWVVSGNHVSDNNFFGCKEMTSWYFITELDTMASEGSGAVVCIGDSLTDGASVTTNGFARYTDELARQLQADYALNNISVVNSGIGATSLMGWGSAGSARFDRDVLNIAGVKYCILYYGVNDIGYANGDISGNIIDTYKSMIQKCHNNGIKIYGCTITPFKNPYASGYYSELHESIRLKVNEFIKSADSGFDGYIDLSSAVASQNDPAMMDPKYVSVWNDYLHFNDSGYAYVGQTIYRHLKSFIG